MLLATKSQEYGAIRTRLLDYCAKLATDEKITQVTTTVYQDGVLASAAPGAVSPLQVATVLTADQKGFTFRTYNGDAGVTYCIHFQVDTTYQRFQDKVAIEILEDDC